MIEAGEDCLTIFVMCMLTIAVHGICNGLCTSPANLYVMYAYALPIEIRLLQVHGGK